MDRNILTVACSHFRNSAHLHDPVAGFRKFLGAGHGLIVSGVARRASDRTIARLCGGHNFSLLGGGDSFVDPRSVGARSTTRTRAIAWSPAGREEEGATPFLRPGGCGEERRKKCGLEALLMELGGRWRKIAHFSRNCFFTSGSRVASQIG